MRKSLAFEKIGICAICLLSLLSCKKENTLLPESSSHSSMKKNVDITFYALEGGTMIDKISTRERLPLNSATISGIQGGETILAIDFRPATGELYGLSSAGKLYVINPETGAARTIGNTTIMLDGTMTGFDFNPTVDRIRVVTDKGQNLRVNPETGTVAATDLPINGVAGAMVTGAAYTNNVAGAATTTLYDIDVATQSLYRQLPPNDGKLELVGPLNLKISGEGGFDIAAGSGIALGMYKVNNLPALIQINLMTGDAIALERYERKNYTGLAIPTRPVAYAVDLMNNLHIFNPTDISTPVSKKIGPLNEGENILGLDFRPLNGQLYALTSQSRILTINASNGMVGLVGTLSTPLAGNDFGFDFNPVVDRIRIVSNTGQNLRYNPNDPLMPVIEDGMLKPGTPAITAAAYANNFAGTTMTMLFDIDVNTDKLYLQNPPNMGVLSEIGNLGVNASEASGFDIGSTSGKAWAMLMVQGATGLYEVNTVSGAATLRSSFPAAVNGFTIGLGF